MQKPNYELLVNARIIAGRQKSELHKQKLWNFNFETHINSKAPEKSQIPLKSAEKFIPVLRQLDNLTIIRILQTHVRITFKTEISDQFKIHNSKYTIHPYFLPFSATKKTHFSFPDHQNLYRSHDLDLYKDSLKISLKNTDTLPRNSFLYLSNFYTIKRRAARNLTK